MPETVTARELITLLKETVGSPIEERFASSREVTAEKNKIKSGDHCLNLIGSNLVVYSTDNEKQKAERREILSLLEQLLDNAASQNETAEKTHTALLCAMETQRAMLSDLGSEIFHKLSALKQESLLNARANLHAIMNGIWRGVYATTNAAKILSWCHEIKLLSPEDFIANFCESLFGKDTARLSTFFEDNLKDRSDEDILFVLRTMLGKLEEEHFEAMDYWIEELQNRENKQFNYFRDRYDEEKERLLKGVYDPDRQRDVFIAFSRKDFPTVLAVKNYLKEKGSLECFLSTTNLRQCDGEEFPSALKTAIDHCSVFLLISSKNSRMRRRDGRFCAYKEMEYVRDKELKLYRHSQLDANANYTDLPRRCKMMRLEYLLDARGDTAGDDLAKEFFDGLNPVSGLDPKQGLPTLLKAINRLLNNGNAWREDGVPLHGGSEEPAAETHAPVLATTDPSTPAEKEPQKTTLPKKKYCVSCLTECDGDASFCSECGSTDFLSTYEAAKSEKESKYCIHCLTRNALTAKFCKTCGGAEFKPTKADAERTLTQIIESWHIVESYVVRGYVLPIIDLPEAVKSFSEAAAHRRPEALFSFGWCYRHGLGVTKDPAKATDYFAKAVDLFTKEAKQGNADAQCSLGWCYDAGLGVTKDRTKAAEWYAKAAEQGHADAQSSLGSCYYNGYGVIKDYAKAVDWFTKAAEQGYSWGQNSLGLCFKNGYSVTKDPTAAAEWFARAAEQGNPSAQYNLGAQYRDGKGVTKDPAKALELFSKSAMGYTKVAEKGQPGAQYNLALCYENGEGVVKDPTKAVEWYTKAAEQGHAHSQNSLGWCYENGEGVTKDLAKAVEWYTKAAEQGHAMAQSNLGLCYANGKGVTKDYNKAVMWFTKAAEQGDTYAQFRLGWCYENGDGVTKDSTIAVEWYTKAAEQGYANAQFNLGVCYETGKGVTKDPVKAAEWYTKAAEQGNANAQFGLGSCYANGEGVTKNPSKAVEWYTKAAKQGNAKAQDKLGVCYYYGKGTTQDYNKTVMWFTKAAEQGFAHAQCALGECYYWGRGVTKDPTKAVEWYTKAAEQGNAYAQSNLAECYYWGSGVIKDPTKAVDWATKAAEQEYADAQFRLGYCYKNGKGVTKDPAKGVEWYTKAAAQGHANAQFNLGVCYENGEGVTKDLAKAVEWYTKAANNPEAMQEIKEKAEAALKQLKNQ